MRVALYARVSSRTQEKAGTIASQVAALRSHASKAGDTICEEFVCRDDGV
jgi:DNA invertase Pin-like site-specific DNA recombinase